VGYGLGMANDFEGTQAPTLTNMTADIRAGGGCVDTNSNLNDFTSGAPNPRNSASSANPCGFPTDPVSVPEPSTWVLMTLVLGTLGYVRRRVGALSGR